MGQSDLSASAYAELIRLIEVVRNPQTDDLLAELLNGTPASVASVTKLLAVARKYFDERGGILSEIEMACTEYLKANSAPVPKRLPCPGEPGFRSVLDEFGETERIQNARLNAYCRKVYGREYSFPRDSEVLVKCCKDEHFRQLLEKSYEQS